MKILLCYLYTDKIDSGNSFRDAFKALGHEVWTCGPKKGNFGGEFESGCDIKVFDRETHPEEYTYNEILTKAGQSFDLILQLDPNFYFVGEKPKDVFSAYYIVDIHRGGDVFRRMALKGNFNIVFVAQKYFIPLLERSGLNCYWLPRAYDSLYIKEYSDIETEVDISFCGQSGIHPSFNSFSSYDEKIGCYYHGGKYPRNLPIERFLGYQNTSMEYAARAEILIRLSNDFNVRVYEELCGEKYPQSLCRGKITVNRSLYYDSALRNFEVMACNRFLVTDELPYQEELFNDKVHCRTYRSYYQPQFSNFDLDYECIKDLIQYYLKHDDERLEICQRGKGHVEKNHTFINRAERVVRIAEKYKKGCYESGDRYTYL